MTQLTALELAGNYPDNTLIASREALNRKFAVFCYMVRDEEIHKLMLNSQLVFGSVAEAENCMHEVAKEVKQQYS